MLHSALSETSNIDTNPSISKEYLIVNNSREKSEEIKIDSIPTLGSATTTTTVTTTSRSFSTSSSVQSSLSSLSDSSSSLSSFSSVASQESFHNNFDKKSQSYPCSLWLLIFIRKNLLFPLISGFISAFTEYFRKRLFCSK